MNSSLKFRKRKLYQLRFARESEMKHFLLLIFGSKLSPKLESHKAVSIVNDCERLSLSRSRKNAAARAKPALKHGRCSVVHESDDEANVDELNKCAIGSAVDRRDKSSRSKSVAFHHEVTDKSKSKSSCGESVASNKMQSKPKHCTARRDSRFHSEDESDVETDEKSFRVDRKRFQFIKPDKFDVSSAFVWEAVHSYYYQSIYY